MAAAMEGARQAHLEQLRKQVAELSQSFAYLLGFAWLHDFIHVIPLRFCFCSLRPAAIPKMSQVLVLVELRFQKLSVQIAALVLFRQTVWPH